MMEEHPDYFRMSNKPAFQVTPLCIDMLVHFCTSGAAWPHPNAPACIEMIGYLWGHGLIDSRGSTASATERGQAWLRMMRQTPLPAQSWVDPRTQKTVPEEFTQ